MTQAIEILEKHRLFLIEVEREADVQDAIKAVVITVKQQAEEIQRLRAAHEEIQTLHNFHAIACSERDKLQLECDRLRKQLTEVCDVLKYYSEACDEASFADWGERGKISVAAIEAAMKEEK